MRKRLPAAAGRFYPSDAAELKKQISEFCLSLNSSEDGAAKINETDCYGCILPHAGYIYSGTVAVSTIRRVNLKDKIILLGPNHTGYGAAFSIMCSGLWQTPLGKVEIDETLAGCIKKNVDFLKDDSLAQEYEHSIEVELPILQYFKENFKIVPITILSDDLHLLKQTGFGIAAAIKELNLNGKVTLVASSDMTHYEPQSVAYEKDNAAIKAILELDEEKLIDRVAALHITMCGYAPVAVMISAAKILGAQKAELIKYQTSGDTTGDKNNVVGYAGIVIY